MKRLFYVMLGLVISLPIYAQSNNQLINWFAGADIVGTTGSDDINQTSDFYVREFELSAFSIIDQTWSGILTLAYHKEQITNEEHLEVHEAFLFSSKLFPLANVKIGKFFLGFGRLNRFHRHDWIFTEAPLVQKSFFGNEGAKDSGVEYKRNILALNSTLSIGLTKGDEFNHTHAHDEHEEGEIDRAKSPTAYSRFAKFFEYSTTRGLEIGLNAINRVDAHGVNYQYAGMDFIYKDRLGKVLTTVVQSEIWSRNTIEKDNDETHSFQDIGGYLYIEKGLDQHHAYGVRYDYYKPDDHVEEADHEHGIDGLEVDKEFNALAVSYIYTNSEFMRTRVTLEHGVGVVVDSDPDVDRFTRGQVQFVFSIGAHPSHVY